MGSTPGCRIGPCVLVGYFGIPLLVRLTASTPAPQRVLKREKRDEVLARQTLAEYGEPDIRNPVEQVAMVSASEAVADTCIG